MIGDMFHSADITGTSIPSNRTSSAEIAYNVVMKNELDSPGNRLRWARERAGFSTAKSASEKAGVSAVNFRAFENDQHSYRKFATHFARCFGVTTDWLLDGGPTPGDAEDMPAGMGGDSGALSSSNIEMVRQVDISYAMGDGSFIDDYPDVSYVPFDLEFLRRFARGATSSLFIATGQGDSMSPTIDRDDLVMIDMAQNRITFQDQIFALAYAGTGMIKRVRPMAGGRIHLLSDNPLIPPIEVDAQDVHVVGKVVWSARIH